LSGEIQGQQRRDEQLKDCSTPEMQCLAKVAEEQVPAFVNGKVDVVEHGELAEVPAEIEQHKSVEADPAVELTARNRQPLNFGNSHCAF